MTVTPDRSSAKGAPCGGTISATAVSVRPSRTALAEDTQIPCVAVSKTTVSCAPVRGSAMVAVIRNPSAMGSRLQPIPANPA